jgi:molybdopterin-guanine dinucleotide biosynthesis protein A
LLDTLPLPENLVETLEGDGPATFETQHLIGYWPVSCRAALTAYLSAGRRSVAGWIDVSGARSVAEPDFMQNANVPAEMVALEQAIRAVRHAR